MNVVCVYLIVLYSVQILAINSFNISTKENTEDDYYVSYDYDISNNSDDSKAEPLLLPVSEMLNTDIDDLPNVDLPDDSLADPDLHDHDLIDNIKYVCIFGYHHTENTNLNSEFILTGAILSFILQFVTIIVIVWGKCASPKREINAIFLHFMACYGFATLVFMFEIYATKHVVQCQIVAVVLHYLYLLTSFWIFLFCYYVYKWISVRKFLEMHYFFLIGYGLPAILTVASFVVTPAGYEIKKFCFVSIKKGMILSYMIPISIFMVLTVAAFLGGNRRLNLELSKLDLISSAEFLNAFKAESEYQEQEYDTKGTNEVNYEITCLKECKRFLKAVCFVQITYDVTWFFLVLALDNPDSNVVAGVYMICTTVLNIYILLKHKSFQPALKDLNSSKSGTCEEIEKMVKSPNQTATRGSTDNIPLLINNENGTEMREIRHEHICTISG